MRMQVGSGTAFPAAAQTGETESEQTHIRTLKKTLLILFTLLCGLPLAAQRSQTFTDEIRTLRLEVEGQNRKLPVLTMGTNERLRLSFDDMTHEYRRFTYRVEHCGWDWQPTEGLFPSDYLEAVADEEVIEGYEQSMNTSVLYTHYSFTLPNRYVRPLLSGNYRVTVSVEDDDGEPRPVLVGFFSMVEPAAGISAEVTTNTDLDWNASHQQLSLSVSWGRLPVYDARTQLKAVVLQNGRWDNARRAPRPTSVTGTALLWEHQRDLIFPAGNEYRKFEMLTTRYPGMGIERTAWYDPYYHAELFPAAPRRNYLYDEDRNGQCVIRNDEGMGRSAESGSDYLLTHFRLETPPLPDMEVYLNGDWTHGLLTPDYRMAYNEDEGAYEATLLLKEGYYSYQYLAVKADNPHVGLTGPVEGDFFQTENEYDVLVYFRGTADRYDRLVGHRAFSFRKR